MTNKSDNENEYLTRIEQMLGRIEAAFVPWLRSTSPSRMKFEVTMDAKEVFSLHFLQNQMMLIRLEIAKQGMLTRQLMRELHGPVKDAKAEAESPEVPGAASETTTEGSGDASSAGGE